MTKLVRELTTGDKQVRRDAALRLSQMGPAAKPAVAALVKAMDDQDRQVGENALDALAQIGPDAREAIPGLIDALDGRKVRGGRNQSRQQSLLRAAFALTRIGPEAIPPLIKALSGDDFFLRIGAAKALGGMGPSAKEAVPALIANFRHSSPEMQTEAMDALSLIGADAVPKLQEALGNDDARMRQGAAIALGEIGKPAKDAGAKLAEVAANDQDLGVRNAALGAVVKVGVDPAQTLPLLEKGLRSGDEKLRHTAVNGLASIRPASAAVDALQKMLAENDPAVQQRAAHALGRLASRAASAAPALVACAEANPAESAFPEALAQIGEPSLPLLVTALSANGDKSKDWIFRALRDMGSAAMPVLAEGLRSPNAAVRAAATRAFGDLPTMTQDVVFSLTQLLADSDADVRAGALRSLSTVRTQREAMIPKLETALQDPAPQVRKAASAGLASIGAVDKVNVQGLIDLLADPDVATQTAAVRSLGERGGDAGPAVAALTARLGDSRLQMGAAESLGKIGVAAESAVPRLLEAVHGTDREMKITAMKALGDIGRPADQILPVFYEGMGSDDREVRLNALQSVIKTEPNKDKLLPVLLKSIQEDQGRLRRVAAAALAPYGEKAQSAAPALVAMLDRETDRPAAFEALRAIHVHDLPLLLTALNHKDAKVRAFACDLLGDLGPQAKEAAPVLEEKAQGDAEAVRDAARKALGRINAKS